MENVILLLYEMATVFVPMGIYLVISRHIDKCKGSCAGSRHDIGLGIYTVYMWGIFHFTGAGTLEDALRYGLHINTYEVNLLPFSDSNIDVAAYLLNLLLMVPLGFLLPLLWTSFQSIPKILLAGFCVSIGIELSQLLNIRRSDVDDLILNVVGCLLGAFLYKILCKPKSGHHMLDSFQSSCFWEMALLTTLLFLCRFLFFYEFAAAKQLWHIAI